MSTITLLLGGESLRVASKWNANVVPGTSDDAAINAAWTVDNLGHTETVVGGLTCNTVNSSPLTRAGDKSRVLIGSFTGRLVAASHRAIEPARLQRLWAAIYSLRQTARGSVVLSRSIVQTPFQRRRRKSGASETRPWL